MRIPISPPWIAVVLRPDPNFGSSQRGDRAVTTVVPGRIGMLILLDALAMPTPGTSGHSVTALKGYSGGRRFEALSAGVSASGNHGSTRGPKWNQHVSDEVRFGSWLCENPVA